MSVPILTESFTDAHAPQWLKKKIHAYCDTKIHYSDIIEECRKKEFDDASQWLLEDWISTLAKGGGAKKIFHCCVNPNSSNDFLYLRAIQGHSGDNLVESCIARQRTVTKGIY